MNDFYTSVERYRGNILYRGYKNGKRIQKKIKYRPTLYLASKEPSLLRSLEGKYLHPTTFDSMTDCKKFLNSHDAIENFVICGNTHYPTAYIGEEFPDKIKPDFSLINVTSLDIENAKGPDGKYGATPADSTGVVTLIQLKSNLRPEVHVWGLKVYDPSKAVVENVDNKNIVYHHCEDEIDLLSQFLTFWNDPIHTPDVLTGYNTEAYDIPYLYHRIMKLMSEDKAKLLSPWKVVTHRVRIDRLTGREDDVWDLMGIPHLDYMMVFKKFGLKYKKLENAKLKTVASEVLDGRTKIDFDEYHDLEDLYENNFQKFVDYGITDSVLVEDMETESGLINLAMTIAYKAGTNFNDAFGTTRVWSSMIERHMRQKNILLDARPFVFTKDKYDGGYVKPPVPGMYDWVCSFDLASLYPNLIIQYNISPDTIVPGAVEGVDVSGCIDKTNTPSNPDYSMAANGSQYRKDHQGFIPEIVEGIFDERKEFKRKMIACQKRIEEMKADPNHCPDEMAKVKRDESNYGNLQMALKILLNSIYGSMGSAYFRWYDTRMAEGITLSGQYAIKTAERAVNDYINKLLKTTDEDFIIAIDTDSCYVHMEKVVNTVNPKDPVEFLDTFCKHVEKRIKAAYEDMFRHMSAFKPRMDMDREVIATRGLWTAKKRYILDVHDNEGVRYAKPKIKIQGIQVVSSATPTVVRKMLKASCELVMRATEAEMQEEIKKFKGEYRALPVEKAAMPRGVSDVIKWKLGDSGLPYHVRASLVYNKALDDYDLEGKYFKIRNGDRIKLIYLKMPNPLFSNVIAFPDQLPKELDLEQYIDYELNFEKTYLKPMDAILGATGWEAEKVFKLSMFGFAPN